ncbi:hypothetical protein [Variovorax soli]|uniref:Uncharacterized protein n=1 Tax=Variovorax soli TaxID=376815 RepID=A0ABU1NLJ7_9BURK|nr:hypothetical protein [Variovorax soli]MDR6539339.1 hypothetical protein [Variovorax soli]
MGATVAGEVTAGQSLGDETDIYIPIYGPAGIDSGIVGYTAATVGFLAGMGTIAALAAGVPVAAGVGVLAVGIGLVAAAVNPAFQEHVFDIADHVRDYLNEKVADGTIPAVVHPIDIPEFDWSIPGGIEERTNGCFRDARAWRQPAVDPLMLDLDGDGLELKRASASILFDHNADTIKTGTGWIGSDDGILVRDLNGNGSIDSGRELFGIDTVKRDGKNAVSGFDALSDLDSNADGQFNAADLAWSSVQVWRDLDQDGMSEAGELFNLDALGISRIGVVGSTANATGGIQAGTTVSASLIAQSASFTRQVDGVQVNRTVGAVDLESNPFYREFTMAVPLTEQAKALPQMQGSGRARDLSEAVSLSPSLGVSLAAFSSATTRDAQRAQLDNLLTQWAQGSDFWQSLETTLAGNVTISGLPAGMTEAQYRNLVGVLEVFNGERFYSTGASGTTLTAGTTKTTTTDTATQVTRAGYGIAPPAAQLALLQQSYDALKESIYSALVLQTRLKPYLDAIELTLDDSGIRFDTTALTALLDQKKAASERDAMIDLFELNRYAMTILDAVGFDSFEPLQRWMEAVIADQRMQMSFVHLNSLDEGDDIPPRREPRRSRRAPHSGSVRTQGSRKQKALRHEI